MFSSLKKKKLRVRGKEKGGKRGRVREKTVREGGGRTYNYKDKLRLLLLF